MASKYIIDFTNQEPQYQFTIQPYTTNGPEFPTSNNLSSRSTKAATSLLLYGKGVSDYGERIAENFVHLLENFAGEDEPKFAIPGQIWYRKDKDPAELTVFNGKWKQILSNPNNEGNDHFSISGDYRDRFTTNFRFRIFNDSETNFEQYTVAEDSEYDSNSNKTTIRVTQTPSSTRSSGNWFVGGWESFLQSNVSISDDFDFNNNRLINVQSPVDLGDAVNLEYANDNFVNVSGDTLTGFLTLHQDPTDDLHAATKQYIDGLIDQVNNDISTTEDNLQDVQDNIDNVESSLQTDINNVQSEILPTVEDNALLIDGSNPMNAQLDVGGFKVVNMKDPSNNSDATTKQWVEQFVSDSIDNIDTGNDTILLAELNDTDFSSLTGGEVLLYDSSNNVWVNETPPFVRLDGSTMTGRLTLSADPNSDLHAATKQYVDNQVSNATGNIDRIINDSGHVFDPPSGTLTIERFNGDTFDITGFDYKSWHIDHRIRPFWQNDNSSDYLESRYAKEDRTSVTTERAIHNLSEAVGAGLNKNKRAIFKADGTSTEYNTFLPQIPEGSNIQSIEGLQPIETYLDDSTITISGDWTEFFKQNDSLIITGGNNQSDSPFTIASDSTYDSTPDVTTIEVSETFSSITVDNDHVLLPAHFDQTIIENDTAGLRLYARDTTLNGRNITVTIEDTSGTADLSLDISVSGDDITISPSTDSNGDIDTLVSDVVSGINNDTFSNGVDQMVYAEIAVSDTTIASTEQTHLESVVLRVTEEYESRLPADEKFNIINSSIITGQYTVDFNGSRNGDDETFIPITTTIEHDLDGEIIVEQRNCQYVVGINHLDVYVNGQRFYMNERGSASIMHDSDDPTADPNPSQTSGFFPNAKTGLTSGTTYSFTVSFDNNSSYTVSVPGADAATFSELIDQINEEIGPNGNDDGIAVLEDQKIVIYSRTTGDSSSVALLNQPASSESSLINNLVGEDTSGISSTWDNTVSYSQGDRVEFDSVYYIALTDNSGATPETNQSIWRPMIRFLPKRGVSTIGTTFGVSEQGHPGEIGTTIQFTTPPEQGAVIETIVSKTQAFAI